MDIYGEVRAFFGAFRGEKRVIGESVLGRKLYAIRIGRGSPCILSQYAMHGREWVTSLLGIMHARRGVNRGSLWILPLVNPDGAMLSSEGIGSAPAGRRHRLLGINGSDDFSLWKANADGVDLNVNFDARWGTGIRNVRRPAPENYIGEAPFCASETAALRDFTLWASPDLTVSWHTKGEEIYWKFFQPPIRRGRDRKLARLLSRATGYPLAEAKGSAGGYKDWCVEKLHIPAFTVEAGRDSLPHPLGREALPDILEKNIDALVRLTEGFGWKKNLCARR